MFRAIKKGKRSLSPNQNLHGSSGVPLLSDLEDSGGNDGDAIELLPVGDETSSSTQSEQDVNYPSEEEKMSPSEAQDESSPSSSDSAATSPSDAPQEKKKSLIKAEYKIALSHFLVGLRRRSQEQG
jgi:hypothetical protein